MELLKFILLITIITVEAKFNSKKILSYNNFTNIIKLINIRDPSLTPQDQKRENSNDEDYSTEEDETLKILSRKYPSNFSPHQPIYILGNLAHHSNACPYITYKPYTIKVALWTNIIDMNIFPAFKCTRSVQQLDKTFHESLPTITTTQTRLSKEACHYMAKYHVSPASQSLIKINETNYETDDQMQINTRNNWNDYVVNYHLQLINISVNQETGLLQSKDTQEIEPCSLDKEICFEGNHTIIWTHQGTTSCEYKKYTDNHCSLTKNQLVCPTIGISVTKFNHGTPSNCEPNIGPVRARITDLLLTENPSTSNDTVFYQVDLQFENLYNSIKTSRHQLIQLYHISSCGSPPLQ
jgi:hypothetical protein